MSEKNLQICEIANQYGTPLYIYKADIIEKNYKGLSKALSKHAEIFYSFKANPNISICAYLKSLGARAEVCSLAELETALLIGFPPENIIFVGPAKSDEELKRAIEIGIYVIVCESFNEIDRIEKLAIQLKSRANIAIRINPGFSLNSALLKMGGKASQFGISYDQIPASIEKFSSPNLKFKGIHIYNGTRVLNSEDIVSNTLQILTLATALAKKWDIEFDMVDMGGGFGVPYYEKEETLNLDRLAEGMLPLLSSFKNTFPHTRLIFESGRYLVAESGIFITKVQDIKESHGEKYLVTDGGTNCHMAAIGINSIVKRNFPIYSPSASTYSNISETYHITGPLCTPGDLIGKSVNLPKLNVGDFIAIKMSGAYGPSASPTYFLSHGYPAEVMIYAEKSHLIRQRDSVENLLANQQLLNF